MSDSAENQLQPLDPSWTSWDVSRLELEIERHNRRYWDESDSEISDYDYDRLVEHLKGLSPSSPILTSMGPSIGQIGDPVIHERPMLSLDKCYTEEDLLKWAEKFEGSVLMTPKIDGVACSLRYDKAGRLSVAATRGDGDIGESITANVHPMSTVPHSIPALGVEIEVRGEIYMSLSAFSLLTDRFSNPRNAAAGTLKRKEARYAEAVGLRFFAYDVIGLSEDLNSSRLDLAETWGFDPVPSERLNRDQLQRGYEGYVARRDQLDYEIDGVVYRVDSTSAYEALGFTAHHPRGAIAYKLQGESASTTLKAIEWGVSRNGLLTPVGIVEPVKLSGAMVSRISLHNWGLVKAKELSIGAEVVAMRRGGVIPHLELVVTPGPQRVEAPKACPQCPQLCAPTIIEGDQIFCGYDKTCDPQAAAILKHFVTVTKIEGFGSVWLETLTQLGILNTPIDLFTLTVKKVISLEGVGQVRAKNWIKSVDQARAQPLASFLTALGIRDLGKSAAVALAEKFLTIDAVRLATPDQISALYNFGERTAEHIVAGLSTRSDLIDQLLEYMVIKSPPPPSKLTSEGAFIGSSFLFTGTLVAMKRAEAQTAVKRQGGSTPSSVSTSLTFLVVGDAGKAGSKLTKAQKLGVTVLTEAEFVSMLERSVIDPNPSVTKAPHSEPPHSEPPHSEPLHSEPEPPDRSEGSEPEDISAKDISVEAPHHPLDSSKPKRQKTRSKKTSSSAQLSLFDEE
jgi:DNA ligase (NAD+)